MPVDQFFPANTDQFVGTNWTEVCRFKPSGTIPCAIITLSVEGGWNITDLAFDIIATPNPNCPVTPFLVNADLTPSGTTGNSIRPNLLFTTAALPAIAGGASATVIINHQYAYAVVIRAKSQMSSPVDVWVRH